MSSFIPATVGPVARGAFTTRMGGVSGGPWDGGDGAGGRNLAEHVGDDPAAVSANRARTEAQWGRPIVWMNQHHSARVAVLQQRPPDGRAGDVDATVLHGLRDCAAGVLVADCVPLLLAAGEQPTVAAVHVGRRGLISGIVPGVVDRMTARGVAPATIYASLGPSVCGRCYEVPAELQEGVAAQVTGTATTTSWGTPGLDIAAGVIGQLRARGVRHIEHLEICTRTDNRFYSYRRDGQTGRFAGIIGLAAYDTPQSSARKGTRLV